MILNIFLSFLASLLISSFTYANSCSEFVMNIVDAGYYDIYGGQESVGQVYALAKALFDVELDPTLPFESLTDDQKQKLKTYILEELKEPIPAVRSPSGKYFIMDSHHSVYVVYKLFEDQISDINFKLQLMYDSKTTGISENDFIDLSIQSHWFYAPTALSILRHPMHIHELKDNVERSQLGLFFMSIEQEYGVPMKGKYFETFIQFYLADFIRENQIMVLPSEINFDDIPKIREELLKSKQLRDFLISKLRQPITVPKLLKFLNNKQIKEQENEEDKKGKKDKKK